MKNLKILLAYEGSAYFGWQDSQQHPSIEGELKKVLSQILQHPIRLQAASRTDAGVHAERQVANFFTSKASLDLGKLRTSVNQMLPPSIRIWELEEVSMDFHPTLDAKGKEYAYRLTTSPVQLPFYRHLAWHVSQPLQLDQIETAIPLLVGQRDFSSFCNANKRERFDRICHLRHISLEREREELVITIQGDRFLYKMVRNLVGTLVAIGKGDISFQEISRIFSLKDRRRAGVTAPAHGLCLKRVFY